MHDSVTEFNTDPGLFPVGTGQILVVALAFADATLQIPHQGQPIVRPNLTKAHTLAMRQSGFVITRRVPEEIGRAHHQHGIARNKAQLERPQEGAGGEQVHQHAHHDGGNAKAQPGQAQSPSPHSICKAPMICL